MPNVPRKTSNEGLTRGRFHTALVDITTRKEAEAVVRASEFLLPAARNLNEMVSRQSPVAMAIAMPLPLNSAIRADAPSVAGKEHGFLSQAAFKRCK
jgi:hypothetical protein